MGIAWHDLRQLYNPMVGIRMVLRAFENRILDHVFFLGRTSFLWKKKVQTLCIEEGHGFENSKSHFKTMAKSFQLLMSHPRDC